MTNTLVFVLYLVLWTAVLYVLIGRPIHRLRNRFSPEYRIRREQREADAAKRRAEARKATEAMQAERNLEWALANSSTAAARRYLEEKLVELDGQVKDADRDIRLNGYTAKGEGSEAEKAKENIAEAEARKAADQELADKVRGALGVVA